MSKKPSRFGFIEQMDSGSHKKFEQSLQIGDNSIQPITPSDAMRGRETTYCDITDNGVSEETAAIVKGETIYSEIPPTAGQSGGGGGAAAMDSDFRSAREPGRGGQAEEEGRGGLDETATAAAGMPPEEALYEQPVGQPNLRSGGSYFKLTTNCSCNCLHNLQDLFTIKKFRIVYVKPTTY